jgi:hypothetical protein
VKLSTVLANACKDYTGDTIYTNNQHLSHRQLLQKVEANRALTQTLRLSQMNLQKKAVRAARTLKTYKKITMKLAADDIPGVR